MKNTEFPHIEGAFPPRSTATSILRALAFGDAVGAPFEFAKNGKTPDAIQEFINSAPVMKVTDDTQMALYTLDAAVEIALSGMEIPLTKNPPNRLTSAEKEIVSVFGNAYGRWQHLDPRNTYSRAPGETCLTASKLWFEDGEAAMEYVSSEGHERLGSGSVMRSVPLVALRELGMDDEQIKVLAYYSGIATHPSPICSFMNDIVIAAALDYSNGKDDLTNLDSLERLDDDLVGTVETLSKKGGFSAPAVVADVAETFSLSVRGENSIEEIAILSTIIGNDSDTVSAIACAIASLSFPSLPRERWDRIESHYRQVIDGIERIGR